MNYEKIRLKVSMILLGKQHAARFAVLFPRLLKALQVLLWIQSVSHTEVFENGKQGLLLSFSFAAVSILLYFVTVSFELLRDRWLCSELNRNGKSFYEFFTDFSFDDFLLAIKLSAVVRVRSILRTVLFMAFPLAVSVYCFELSGFEMSRLKWGICVAGCTVLLALGGFFAAVSVCPLFAARRVCCFELKHAFSAFCSKTLLLDRYCFRLFGFNLTFHPFRSAKKALAAIIIALTVIGKQSSDTHRMTSVNKL